MALIISQCANPVSPQGGPKDEIPPTILDMNPPNYSAFFNQQRMIIQFDEYVKLQGLNNQLMISPPLASEPHIRTKGKSVVIDIEEKLRDSTTYTFYFGDAIVDINEGNPLKNFEYVFSTGSLIDSMAVKGTVLGAFDMLPKDGVAVMLYTLDVDTIPIDSLPILSRPVYVSRTNEKGEFELNNLRNIPYKLIALLDMNSNYLYDLPNEEIAFSDTIIMPAFLGRKIYIPHADTARADTTKKVKGKSKEKINAQKAEKLEKRKPPEIKQNLSDTTGIADTTAIDNFSSKVNPGYKPQELFMFLAVDSTQQIIESTVSKGSLITFRLKYPCDTFQLNPINFFPSAKWNLLETNRTNDTILCWVIPSMPDSLTIEFVADSEIIDTLKFVLNKVNPNAIIDTNKIERISVRSNITVGKMELGKKLSIESEYPLLSYDFSKVIWIADSLVSTPEIKFKDSVNRVFYFDHELTEKIKYKLIIPDSALIDIKGRANDSIIYEFETKLKEKYATLVVNATFADSTKQWIIQLIEGENKIVGQRIVDSSASAKLTFDYLKPIKYKLKAILDENRNGIWDTGNYLMHRQAERILTYESEIEARENWVTDQSWELK